jgi:micrococcal nuclease
MYNYKATCTRVVGGDTIEVTIDLGFCVMFKETVRLKEIDTPESRTKNTLEKQAGLKVK